MQNNHTVDKDKFSELLCDSSRSLADLAASMICDDPELLKPLLSLIWSDHDPWSNRASRVFSICCCRFPGFMRPYSTEIIKKMGNVKSEGVLRNMLKIFSETNIKLSESSRSLLTNLCFDYLTGNTPVAIKVYSMEIIFRFCTDYPEIMQELYAIIESQMDGGTAGFKSRGTKILKKINKQGL
jgi:hypothetical protein